MKRLIFIVFFIVGISQLFAQENVFSYTFSENIVTQDKDNTKAIIVNRVLLDQVISENSSNFLLKLPLIDESFLNVNMTRFSVLSSEHNLILETSNGQEIAEYIPDFQSYYILFEGHSIGTFLCFENTIIISYKYNNRQFEINKIDNEFLLFDINDCLIRKTFSCEVEEKIEQINIEENYPESSSANPKCLELAVEVDQHTRNTFSSNTTTTNWAHAIIAGVSQVYASETNLNISIVTTIIWEITDPYASYINDASNMLAALRNHWTSNNGSISRDLVHLMTKRSNTGTGGIAYRDVLCSNSWGYAFSASLNNTTNFNFPNPSYTWNLMVCSHEIGHNIESHHTHWCGWPGGPIDNCTDVEGSCTNNPTPQVGTIMSYCHTTSAGSLIDFHSIVVSNALTPGINGASCLTTCTFYGCTDSNATNYDPNATIDDGSCTYSLPVLSAFITDVSCAGMCDGSIDLSVSGGLSPYTYIWSNGFFSEDISNLCPGTYTISVTDALGQIVITSYTITEPAVITPIYIVTNTTGAGMSDGSISVSVSGGTPPYTYYWIGYTSTSSTLSNLSAGTYVSYVLDANNCIVVDSIDVFDDVPTPLQLTYSVTDVLCAGNSTGAIDITVSGGVPPYSYLWSNGSTSEDLANIIAGNYIISVTDAQGQSQLDTIVVNEPLPLSLSFVITNESNAGSNDGSIDMTVTGGTPPFSYFWNTNPSQTTEDITNLSAGNYIVYVGFNNWTCFIIDTVVISVGSTGCTDPNAINYDPNATIDDGSCVYCSCGGITGIYVSDIIHDRATFNWDNMNSSCCDVDQIKIRYREVGANLWSTKTMGSPTGSGCNTSNISKLVLGLTPSTTYEYDFKIWYCSAPTVNWHANGTFTTLGDCPIVDAFSATPLNPTKVQFDWSLNGVYEFVRIKLREDFSGATWFNAGGFGVNYPAITKNKNGLLPGQTYRAQARTWCDPNGGAYRSLSWTSLVFWTQPTSVRLEGGTSINNLTIYPNPSLDIFYITFTSEDVQDLKVRIVNVIGEELLNENLQQFIGEYTKQIDLTNNAKGIYFLQLESNSIIINKKVMLQ
ncbi:M12 family metallo-peptidase [Flavobacteriales bacterium]|nr:M12 family metallo-peptidase [Flavobacteriales bacterium]